MKVRDLIAAVAAGVLAFASAGAPFASAAGADADDVIERMIEAHGGMEAWRDAPTVRFRDHWTYPGSPDARSAIVTVEQGRRRAYHDVPGTGATLGWDGERAWSTGEWSGAPPRFMALLNYYFVNLPWLVRDDGVILGDPGTRSLDSGEVLTAIRMTFEGVGDTPEDYYVLLIDPETHRLRGCEYIVTYSGILPPGVDHTPPNTLLFEELETVDGLRVPTRFTITREDGSVYTTCEVSDWSFTTPFDESRMRMPDGATLDESSPTRSSR